MPVIGITANIFPATDRKFYKNKELLVAERSMVHRILINGGVPLVLPVTGDAQVIAKTVELLDGLLLSGGADVDPSSWGAEVRWPGQPERDQFESALVHALRAKKRPILGVCRGLQLLNVALGGSLLQDIQTDRPSCHSHRSQEMYDQLRHPVTLQEGSWVSGLFGNVTEATINSVHHQAIDGLAPDLEALAWSDDGLIEAVHAPADRWTRGVQWHPEWATGEPNLQLFGDFVTACKSNS